MWLSWLSREAVLFWLSCSVQDNVALLAVPLISFVLAVLFCAMWLSWLSREAVLFWLFCSELGIVSQNILEFWRRSYENYIKKNVLP
jgi:hypothetical protein